MFQLHCRCGEFSLGTMTLKRCFRCALQSSHWNSQCGVIPLSLECLSFIERSDSYVHCTRNKLKRKSTGKTDTLTLQCFQNPDKSTVVCRQNQDLVAHIRVLRNPSIVEHRVVAVVVEVVAVVVVVQSAECCRNPDPPHRLSPEHHLVSS